ncbi:helix-turn-helix transcriptional regulator [Oxalobacter sp. OttesenSCG-928-P03]|nr:helix-turn-helix transcriptional regulator [Oxalobacter sp. OttesenSCG-928-P03]
MKTSYFKPRTKKGYNPNRLLDALLVRQNMKTDAELARALKINPSVISKIRHAKTRISASLLLDMHDMTDMSIRELRNLMGDTKNKYFPFRQTKLS